MHLTPSDIEEYRQMWREEFHEDISPEEARASATQLLDFYLMLLGDPVEGDHDEEDLEQPPINKRTLAPSHEQRILKDMRTKTTEDLATIYTDGFAMMDKHFDSIDQRLDRIDHHLDSLEHGWGDQFENLKNKINKTNQMLTQHLAALDLPSPAPDESPSSSPDPQAPETRQKF